MFVAMSKQNQTASYQPHYHLAYLTANDQSSFVVDFLHFCNMARWNPGVPHVEITIAVSQVRPFSQTDVHELDRLARRADSAKWLSVKAVIWKSNLGRDFSSARICLKSIQERARKRDFVMVRNRSAYGPLAHSWYHDYVAQYCRFPETGLVGSTINLSGHPKLCRLNSRRDGVTHVQTYVYLSQWKHLVTFIESYPGSRCVNRLEVIEKGEIGLSRRIVNAGLKLSCLYWPQHVFDAVNPEDPKLPRYDIKGMATGVPLRYKYAQYLRHPRSLFYRATWVSRRVARSVGGWSPRRQLNHRPIHVTNSDWV